jgi:hypothetical protein
MRIAEQEHLARAKIEEKLAWRDLSSEQEKSLSSKMRSFYGQRFKLITYQDDPETLRLTGKIGRALISAGWSQVTPNDEFLWVPLVVAVDVEVATSQVGKFGDCARALVSNLNAAGINARFSVMADANLEERHRSTVRIKVGKKP